MTAQRVVVVGLGGFGVEHLRCYLDLGQEVCSAVDVSARRRQMIAGQYHVPVADDAVRAIHATHPSLVSIVIGPSHRRPVIEAALAVGARVLVEKPFAATVEEARAIASLTGAREAITPGHILRFDPAHRWVARQVSSGAIGSIIAIDCERHREHGHAERYTDHSLASLTLYHDIDLAMWLDGNRPVAVTADATPLVTAGTPTYLAATIRTAADVLWTLRCSWQLPEGAENRDRLQVFGTEGAIELVVVGDTATATVTAGRGDLTVLTRIFTTADNLRDEIAEFAEGSATSVVSVDDAIRCVRLVRAVEDAASGAARALGDGMDERHREPSR